MGILYHASPIKDLKVIEPKRTLSKNVDIGNFVFATSDNRLAAMYLATKGNAILLNVNSQLPRIIILNSPENYLRNDTGGAIYKVYDENFVKTPQDGLEDSELVCDSRVIPIDKTGYNTSLDAMKEAGIEVYFVNQTQFDDIVNTKKEEHILQNIQPYIAFDEN